MKGLDHKVGAVVVVGGQDRKLSMGFPSHRGHHLTGNGARRENQSDKRVGITSQYEMAQVFRPCVVENNLTAGRPEMDLLKF